MINPFLVHNVKKQGTLTKYTNVKKQGTLTKYTNVKKQSIIM